MNFLIQAGSTYPIRNCSTGLTGGTAMFAVVQGVEAVKRELGILLHVNDHDAADEAIDGGAHGCEVVPREALCVCCYQLLPGWYPKPPPTARLKLFGTKEVAHIPLLGMPVLHEALFDLLRMHWPKAKTTQCVNQPDTKLRIGHKYLSVSVPPEYTVKELHDDGTAWNCEGCKRWYCPHYGEPYIALHPEQRDIPAFVDNWSLYVTAPLRQEIVSLGLGTIAFESIPIFSEPLPQHVPPAVPPPTILPEDRVADRTVVAFVPDVEDRPELGKQMTEATEPEIVRTKHLCPGFYYYERGYDPIRHRWEMCYNAPSTECTTLLAERLLPVFKALDLPQGSFMVVGGSPSKRINL